MPVPQRKRGRVVEGSSLENCRRCEPFVSSNLTASARCSRYAIDLYRLIDFWLALTVNLTIKLEFHC